MIPQHPATEPDSAVDESPIGSDLGSPAGSDEPEASASVAPVPLAPAVPPRSRGLILACLALFLLSVLLAAVAAIQSSRLNHERSDRRAVTDVAGRFATALLTYDYRNLPAAKARVLALSAGRFRQEYEQAYSGGLDVLITQTKGQSEVTVTHLYVGDIGRGQAEAVVVVNQTTTGTTGKHAAIDQYVQLSLVRVSGSWKVDSVTNLTDTQASSQASPGSTPTTTAPTTRTTSK